MKYASVVAGCAALLVLPVQVQANCPNACSGHGTCDASSLCECYVNWMSADCSEQVCSFGRAFVDTPLGDLDGDGTFEPQAGWSSNRRTRVDSKDYYIGHSSELGFAQYGYARNSRNESWDEAHFYRECSNKGKCNRDTGECNCFPGFGGSSCGRALCANDCSGHGVCRNLLELDETYSAWDRETSHQCVCDGGYTGPDCSKRMCPVGADPIEMAQVVPWSIQGIYFRTFTKSEEFTRTFSDVMEFLEDKPEKLFYTATIKDEYEDLWTTSVQTLDYLTECQGVTDGDVNMANCVSTPNVAISGDQHAYIKEHAERLNNTLGHLPSGVFPGHYVWAAAGVMSQQTSGGTACDLSNTASPCGDGAVIQQTSVDTFPTPADASVYVDSLDFRLDTNIMSACEWDYDLRFDQRDDNKFGLCLFVKMPAPGIRPALKVNYWFTASGNMDGVAYSFSEVSGETYGYTTDEELDDSQSLVVVQNLQSKRVWNAQDGDLRYDFIDEYSANMDYCSKRGLCDFTSGICNCFSGFSGLRCDAQNAVTYSF